jgi:hypothetical protein
MRKRFGGAANASDEFDKDTSFSRLSCAQSFTKNFEKSTADSGSRARRCGSVPSGND